MKNKGMNAKKFNKVLYTVLGAVVVVTLSISTYLAIAVDALSRETSKNKYISIKNNSKVEALAKLEDSLRDMSSEEAKVSGYLPNDKEVAQILKDLEAMATRSSLTFNVYEVGKSGSKSVAVPATKEKEKSDISQTEKSGDFYILPLKLTLTGSYMGVSAMLKEIEDYSRLTEVKEIKYSKDPTAGGDIIEATLQVNTYLKK